MMLNVTEEWHSVVYFFILGYLSKSSITKDNRSTEGIQGNHNKLLLVVINDYESVFDTVIH